MTKLATRKSRLEFTTESIVRSRGKIRQVVIEAHRTYAIVRLSGMRHRYSVTWEAVHDFAARLEANRVAEERKAKRKAAKKGER